MSKGRIEAFSDGVIAILITIMVLELHVPTSADLTVLRPLIPVAFFNSWLAFSFYVIVAIIWLIPDPRIEKTLRR